MSLVSDLRARLAVAEETDGPVLLLPVEARDVLAALEKATAGLQMGRSFIADEPLTASATHGLRVVDAALAALAVVFADEKATP